MLISYTYEQLLFIWGQKECHEMSPEATIS